MESASVSFAAVQDGCLLSFQLSAKDLGGEEGNPPVIYAFKNLKQASF